MQIKKSIWLPGISSGTEVAVAISNVSATVSLCSGTLHLSVLAFQWKKISAKSAKQRGEKQKYNSEPGTKKAVLLREALLFANIMRLIFWLEFVLWT